MPLSRVIVLLALILIAAGCDSRAAPQPPVIIPPTPINMTARESYFGYDSSARIIPASYDAWEGMVWVWGGDLVKPGVTYIVPVPTSEGQPTAELVDATSQPDGDLLLGSKTVSVSVVEDMTYRLPTIRFWKIKIDPAQLPSEIYVLRLRWTAFDVAGKPVDFRQYYRIER